MRETGIINELEVELCVELARQFDEEDLSHPPHRDKEDTENE